MLAAVFGDPHFYTFDNMTYTFNGKGEFVLVHADTVRHKFDVQARFEAIPNNVYGTARATVLTAVAGTNKLLISCIFLFIKFIAIHVMSIEQPKKTLPLSLKSVCALLMLNGDTALMLLLINATYISILSVATSRTLRVLVFANFVL